MARMRYYTTIICEECGKEVLLFDSLTNQCENCGAYYNGFGQRLRDDVEEYPYRDGKVYQL